MSDTTRRDAGLDLADMQAILNRRSGRTDIRLREPTWKSLWRANIRLADGYRRGRVLLAGDAAHIHSPAGGQGMNTGIQDAHNLGWKLAVVAHGGPTALLDSYQSERRPVAAGVLALSNARLERTIAEKGLVTRGDAHTMQLTIGYRGSVLARDDRAETAPLHAGDRAPDATGLLTVDGPRRLFDLTRGGRFTLLSFADAPEVRTRLDLGVVRVVAEPTGPGDIADTAGHLAAAYAPRDRTLVLIRPDGYIGMISDSGDAQSISDYLAAIEGRTARTNSSVSGIASGPSGV